MEYGDKCPSSFSEVENASRRLGCGNDKFGNNQYLCLPTAEKDSLIEFCHTGIMGLQEKGHCLESSNGELILENCTHFIFGCPEEHFKSSEIFKYPACQAINRKLRCYMLDPLCQPTGGDDASSNDGMVHWPSYTPIFVVMFCLGVAVAVLVFAVRSAYGKRFKGNRENAAEYGSQHSLIHDGRISRRTAVEMLSLMKRNTNGSLPSKAASNISDPTSRYANETLSSKAPSNISDPITRRAYENIYSKAAFIVSDTYT